MMLFLLYIEIDRFFFFPFLTRLLCFSISSEYKEDTLYSVQEKYIQSFQISGLYVEKKSRIKEKKQGQGKGVHTKWPSIT